MCEGCAWGAGAQPTERFGRICIGSPSLLLGKGVGWHGTQDHPLPPGTLTGSEMCMRAWGSSSGRPSGKGVLSVHRAC